MSDVVLMQLPVWSPYSPPLGLALLKSYLAEQGIKAILMDVNAEAAANRDPDSPDYWDMAQGYNYCLNAKTMLAYYRQSHDFLDLGWIERQATPPGLSAYRVFAANMHISLLFLREMKQLYPNIKYVLGGPEMVTYLDDVESLLTSDLADALCIDEGEIAFTAYVNSLDNATGDSLPGVAYRHEGKCVPAGPVQYIKNLDSLPFPDYDDLDLDLYKLKGYLPSYATRGCLNKCVYCSARGFMKLFRYRSAERMYAEIVHLKKRYPDTVFVRMADNISNGHIGELEKFCDLMIADNPGVQWNLENAVIRKEMRTPLYTKLKAAGCTLLGYGLETPSPHLLEQIGKRLSKGVDLASVLREGKEAGLYVVANIMFGLPGETDADFDYLLDFMAENKDAFHMINPSLTFCEFYPGSRGADNPEQFGLDLSLGSLFWKTTNNENTYPKRMERFERFCRKAKEYGLDNLFGLEELPNKFDLLFQYYTANGEKQAAETAYAQINEENLTPELQRLYSSLNE